MTGVSETGAATGTEPWVVGEAFPPFELPDAHGKIHHLSEYKGRYVVLYIYPKDNTPGCTREACEFKELSHQDGEVIVLGLSRDSAESHLQFADQYELPFALLSDPEASYLTHIGSYGEKKQYGKVSMGIKRQTFLIDPHGRLVKAWKAVKVDGHAKSVAAAIAAHRRQHE